MTINKYQRFLKDKEFESIIQEMFKIVESQGKWVDDRTMVWDMSKKEEFIKDEEPVYYEWDLTKDLKNQKGSWQSLFDRLKKFLSNLDKEEIKSYFIKLLEEVKSLPSSVRKKIIFGYTSIFLLFASANYLMDNTDKIGQKLNSLPKEIKVEVEQSLNRGASFEKSQSIVKSVEAGYSDDRNDTGNWIDIPGYGKRFVGTNHGISAPILAEYLGRLPKKEDMMNLSYETALEIYKKNYWDAQNLSLVKDQSMANIIYDGCVNQGVGRMSGIISEILDEFEIEYKGSPFSSENIEKLNNLNPKKVFELIKDKRLDRYKQASTWSVHGEGWMNRLDTIKYEA